GADDVDGFLRDLVERDRRELAERLQRASSRLVELGSLLPRTPAPAAAGGDPAAEEAWSAHQVLAHIAVLSKFYGMLTYKIGSGQMEEVDLLAQVRMRDLAGGQMAERGDEELIALATADHRRTIDFLRSADAAAMMRTSDLGGRRMSAQDIARVALCCHLEAHLDQLQERLPPRARPGAAPISRERLAAP
ncbi:MAG: hypothetical protein ACREPA_08310, partial [Candidatus Dormibacteraceae bacterium]